MSTSTSCDSPRSSRGHKILGCRTLVVVSYHTVKATCRVFKVEVNVKATKYSIKAQSSSVMNTIQRRCSGAVILAPSTKAIRAYLLTYKDKTQKTGVGGSPTSTRIDLLSQKYSYNKSHSDQQAQQNVSLQIFKTRCSAIAERPRCRVRYSFRQKLKNATGRQYFTDIIGLSSTTVI